MIIDQITDETFIVTLLNPKMYQSHSYDFYHDLTNRIQNLNSASLIIDLSKVAYADSTFWSRIIALVQRCKRLVLSCLNKILTASYVALGVDTLAVATKTVAEAKIILLGQA